MIRLAFASVLAAALAVSGAAAAPTRTVGPGRMLASTARTVERPAPHRLARGLRPPARPAPVVTVRWPSESVAPQPPPAHALFQRPPPPAPNQL